MATVLRDGTSQVEVGVEVVSYVDDPAFSFVDARKQTSKLHYLDNRQGNEVSQILLHHDGMNSAAGCFGVLAQRGLGTHIIIDKDGRVFQTLNLAFAAFHAKGHNLQSIGIDLNNPVVPGRRRGNPARRGGVFRGMINGAMHASMGYTNAQYESLIAVLRGLSNHFPLLRNLRAPTAADGRVRQNRLAKTDFVGLLGHQHVSATKWDPGPGFDWDRVLAGVRGDRLVYPVTVAGARELELVPRKQVMRNAEKLFEAIEAGDSGYFPVGINQAWHTGVHIPLEEKTPIRAPAKGVVVAARMADPDEGMGSPNVVVIEHTLSIDDQEKTFYSVLSHLRKADTSADSEIGWIKRLYADPEMAADVPLARSLNPPSARGHGALRTGRVALVRSEVKAGEIIGYSGRFSPQPDEQAPQEVLDFAIISEDMLFARGDLTFTRADDDIDDDIRCASRTVWKNFTDKAPILRGLVEGAYPMSASEMRAPYRSDIGAVKLRWLAARHVTEFWVGTRFGGVFGGGTEFEWAVSDKEKVYLDRIQRFLWWDDGVTEHVGLPRDGLVWSYHPIALLTHLHRVETQRALQKASGEAAALDGDALEAQRKKDEKAERAFAEQFNTATDHSDFGEIEGFDGAGYDTDGQDDGFDSEVWMRWEQGEWEPE